MTPLRPSSDTSPMPSPASSANRQRAVEQRIRLHVVIFQHLLDCSRGCDDQNCAALRRLYSEYERDVENSCPTLTPVSKRFQQLAERTRTEYQRQNPGHPNLSHSLFTTLMPKAERKIRDELAALPSPSALASAEREED